MANKLFTIEIDTHRQISWFDWKDIIEPWEGLWDITRIEECGLTHIDYTALLF